MGSSGQSIAHRASWRVLIAAGALLVAWVAAAPAAGAQPAARGVAAAREVARPGTCTAITGTVMVSASETLGCVTVESGGALVVYNNGGCGSSYPEITLTLSDGGTVRAGGSIDLYSSDSCDEGGDSALDVSGGTLVNHGTLLFSWPAPCSGGGCANGGNRFLTGNVTNDGTVDIAAATYLQGPMTFNNEGSFDISTPDGGCTGFAQGTGSGITFVNGPTGSIDSTGQTGCAGQTTGNLVMSGNTFREAGTISEGSGTAPVVLLQGDHLHYTGTGAGTIEVQGSTRLSGNLASGQILQMDGSSGNCQLSPATVTAATGFTNAGTITWACAGGGVSLTVSSGTLVNTGTIDDPYALAGNVTNRGTVEVASNQTLTYQSGQFANEGTLSVAGAFQVPGGAAVTFDNAAHGSISGSGSFSMGSGNTFDEAGTTSGLTPQLTGDSLAYTGLGSSTIEVLGATTLSGDIATHQTLVLYAPSGFCQAPGATVTAAGGFTNAGLIEGTCGPGTVTLSVPSGTLTNTGLIDGGPSDASVDLEATVDNEGTLASFYNATFTVSSLTNYDASTNTLTGGTYEATGGSHGFVIPGIDVHTLAATVVLDGGEISDGSNNGLRNLSANQGHLTLDNAGVGDTFSGSLTNSGSLYLGSQPTIRVSGSYTQTSSGTLTTELSSASSYGQLIVSGPASFAGTLAIAKDAAYAPSAGDTLDVVTFPSSSGQFSSVERTDAGNGLHFVLQYTPGAAELVATATSVSVAPAGGRPGSAVTLTGHGFSPGETVAIAFHDANGATTSLAPAVADSTGAFTQVETVPASAPTGVAHFVATGDTSDVQATGRYTVR